MDYTSASSLQTRSGTAVCRLDLRQRLLPEHGIELGSRHQLVQVDRLIGRMRDLGVARTEQDGGHTPLREEAAIAGLLVSDRLRLEFQRAGYILGGAHQRRISGVSIGGPHWITSTSAWSCGSCARRSATTRSISATASWTFSFGSVRRSMVASHQSGTMLVATPPRIVPMLIEGGGPRGCESNRSRAPMRSSTACRTRSMEPMTLAPSHGVLLCAARPWVIMRIHTIPFSATARRLWGS